MDTKKQRKICLIYEFLSEQGGLERELINHSNFLMQEGYDVTILTCHFDKNILSLMPFEGIKIKKISLIKTPLESLNLILCFLGLNKLNKINPDLFISYSFPCNFLLRNKKTKKINYINHYPHFLYEKDKIEWAKATPGVKRWIAVALSWFFGSWLKKLDKKLLLKNNLNFVNSEFTKKRLTKIYNIDFIVSYPPVSPAFKKSKKLIKKKFIFSSSRIIPDKKYEWLIEAVSCMKRKLPLYIAGSVEPSYKKKLIKLAKEMKVNLKILGKLNTKEIIQYYSDAEVFAFPAPKEDFGLVPVESLSCGTPIVVWNDDSGPTEQVINGINGFCAKPYDVKDFAKKIDLCILSKIKTKNKFEILKSTKKFSNLEVKKSFIKEIKKILSFHS